MSRIIFGLLSAIGVLIGIEYNSIRHDALVTATDLASVQHRLAQVEARVQVTEERTRRTAESMNEIERRLEMIDGKLTSIGEKVAVLADRADRGRSASGHAAY